MSDKILTYDKAGVNVAEGDAFVRDIAAYVQTTREGKPWVNPDGSINWAKMPGVDLATLETRCTNDGAGTKPHWAKLMNRHDTVGQDNVAMSVNDLVRDGFVPYEFVNYFASGKLERHVGRDIIAGTARACLEAGCAMTGGETAEMPGVYADGVYDICGSANGWRKHRLDPRADIRPGMHILASRSSGISCNGHSLVTKIVETKKLDLHRPFTWDGEQSPYTLGEHILAPTRICVKEALAAMSTGHVVGCAHITGGGIQGKFGAILPDGCGADIDLDTTDWVWNLFAFLQHQGNVPWTGKGGMDRTFNLGSTMLYVVAPEHVDQVITETYSQTLVELKRIGNIVRASGDDRITLYRPGSNDA